jgi:hypothetical protein
MRNLTSVFNKTSATVIANEVVCFDPSELDNTDVLKILAENGFTIENSIVKNGLTYYFVAKTVQITTGSQYVTAKTLRNIAEMMNISGLVATVHNPAKLAGDFYNFCGVTGTPKQIIKEIARQLSIRIDLIGSWNNKSLSGF